LIVIYQNHHGLSIKNITEAHFFSQAPLARPRRTVGRVTQVKFPDLAILPRVRDDAERSSERGTSGKTLTRRPERTLQGPRELRQRPRGRLQVRRFSASRPELPPQWPRQGKKFLYNLPPVLYIASRIAGAGHVCTFTPFWLLVLD
jgi:hypothetical protein